VRCGSPRQCSRTVLHSPPAPHAPFDQNGSSSNATGWPVARRYRTFYLGRGRKACMPASEQRGWRVLMWWENGSRSCGGMSRAGNGSCALEKGPGERSHPHIRAPREVRSLPGSTPLSGSLSGHSRHSSPALATWGRTPMLRVVGWGGRGRLVLVSHSRICGVWRPRWSRAGQRCHLAIPR
jgi:hypothetical protein